MSEPGGEGDLSPGISLGGGRRVNYPQPSSPAATRFGKANARVGTKPETRLRSLLHRRGLRFRKDHPVRAVDARTRADVVFSRARVAVFVDGCFWHGCPAHGRVPKSNREYWEAKLERNVERDRHNDRALRADGWEVIRAWEHEDPRAVADHVASRVAARHPSAPPASAPDEGGEQAPPATGR